jgi:DNA polymerase-3 subunit gamma/tau
VGKTTIARLLAKALNCEHRPTGSAEPCNECAACKDANSGRFLDTIEIDAASQTKVEETRENIIESIRFAPTRGKYKVFIIDEVHMLSTSSFNALLKTLEEPPAYVVFVLATTELHKIPATIISRCQRFDFHRIPADKVIDR